MQWARPPVGRFALAICARGVIAESGEAGSACRVTPDAAPLPTAESPECWCGMVERMDRRALDQFSVDIWRRFDLADLERIPQ
jgi:hypothetical protein